MENKKIDKNLFRRVSEHNESVEVAQGESLSFFKDARIRFAKNKGAILGLFVLTFIIVFMFIAPYIGTYGNSNLSGEEVNIKYKLLPPKVPGLEKIGILDGTKTVKNKRTGKSLKVDIYKTNDIPENTYFFFGTDDIGRDLFVRTFKGAQLSLLIGFIAAVLDIIIGVTIGGISGYFGGKFDLYTQRVIDIVSSIPTLIFLIFFMMYLPKFEGGLAALPIILAIAVTGWIGMSRMTRAQVFKLKEQEFVLASKTLGGSSAHIIFKHLIPNMLGTIIIVLMFTIPSAIFFEAFLNFLGLGIPGMTSLGSLVNDGRGQLLTNPYILMGPAVILSLIMLTFNLVADGLRDALDPKMRGGK